MSEEKTVWLIEYEHGGVISYHSGIANGFPTRTFDPSEGDDYGDEATAQEAIGRLGLLGVAREHIFAGSVNTPVSPESPESPEFVGSKASPLITDFMIDLETFGTGHNAVIVGIGLAGFNLETGVITPMLDLTISPDSCLERGLTVTGDTILWWTRQSDDARAKINVNQITLQEALFEVIDCMRGEGVKLDDKGESDARVWGNGIRSDNVWLASAFEACKMKAPFEYWNDRDVRTIRDLAVGLGCEDFKKTIEFEGVQHCALDDAVHQAKYVCEYYAYLESGSKGMA